MDKPKLDELRRIRNAIEFVGTVLCVLAVVAMWHWW